MKSRWLCLAFLAACLAPPAWADQVAKPHTLQVPFRLTTVKHVLVRAKINGKGPFNFILDTGAPALFVSTAAAAEVGAKPDRNGWGKFERFEIEGGVVIRNAEGRIEDPFQLRGMNGLGLAGVELHGVIGYNLLARYRIELDFTRTKMAWTPLGYEPPTPERIGGGAAPGGLDLVGSLLEAAGKLFKRTPPPNVPRGFFGIDFEDDPLGVRVKSVIAGGPAARAGLKQGDRVTEFQGRTVRAGEDVVRYAGKVASGEKTVFTLDRGGQSVEITVTAAEGF